ncbi:MAG: ABC transporter permease [Bacillota bacterium]
MSNIQANRERLWVVRPLAFRSLRARWAGGALIALAVGLSVTVFVLFSAYFAATQQAVARRVKPLDLPGDLVVRASAPLEAGFLSGLGRQADVQAVTPAASAKMLTSVGEVEVLGLAAALLKDGEVTMAAGRPPAAPREIMVPAASAARAGLKVGDEVSLTAIADGHAATSRAVLVGLGQSRYGYFAERPVMTAEALQAASGLSANLAIVNTDNAFKVRRFVENFDPRPAGLRVVTADSPGMEARGLVGGVFSSGRLAILFVYVFATLGVLNIILLSFLQRKRALGVLKALGLDNDDLQAYLLLEGALMGLVGLVAGLVASGILIAVFNRHTTSSFAASPGPMVLAAGLSLVVLYAASWLPITLTRRASVNALLQNRRVYLDADSACAQCGRCGGF